DVANRGVAALGAAEHLDAHHFLGTGVVGHVEVALHLDHGKCPSLLGRARDDLDHAPVLGLRNRGHFHQADDADGNHFLALGLDEVVPKEEGPPAYVREVARRGGLGFVAHPVYPPPRRYPLKTFPWTARDVRGFAGVEIWTYSVDWLTDVTTLPRLAAAVAAPDRFVDGPFPEALAWWDALCREAWARGRRVPGIGGADAHGILY